jgi:hypothetical protein
MFGAEAVRELPDKLAIPVPVCEHDRGRIGAPAVFVVAVEVVKNSVHGLSTDDRRPSAPILPAIRMSADERT